MRHWRDESHRPADLGITFHIWAADAPGLEHQLQIRALAQGQWLISLCEILLTTWYGRHPSTLAAFVLQVQVEYNLTCVYMCGVHMYIDVRLEAREQC